MPSQHSDLNGFQNDTVAVLLVGGMGTRLKSVLPLTPKPLARIGGGSFLELLVLQLRAQGVRRLVMCTGHLAEQIEDEFGDGEQWGITIEYSKESRPMGTAGALKLAEQHISECPDFLVMNGDSFVEMNIPEFIRSHRNSGGLASMAVCRVPDSARYGTVLADDQNRVTGFEEKTGLHVPGLINAGAYVFNRDILQQILDGPASLEKDVFPHLLDCGVYGVEQHGMFIDIGTPEDFARAQALCGSLRRAAAAEMHAGISKTGDAR